MKEEKIMKNLKKAWAFILSLVMVASLMAGCGSSQTPATPGPTTDTPQQTSTATTPEPASTGDEIVTLRFSW